MPFFHKIQLNLIIFAIVKQRTKKERNKVNLIRKGFRSIWNPVNKYNDDISNINEPTQFCVLLLSESLNFDWKKANNVRENMTLMNVNAEGERHRERGMWWGGWCFYRSHGALLIIHSCHMLWICDTAMWLLFCILTLCACTVHTHNTHSADRNAQYYQFGLISALSVSYVFWFVFIVILSLSLFLSLDHSVSRSLCLSLDYSILLNLICNIENHWLDFNMRGFFRLNKHSTLSQELGRFIQMK